MSISQELYELADAVAEAQTRRREAKLGGPLRALSDACDQAARAWSGSNLGYHATVYYVDLLARPPHVHFNPDWGLAGRASNNKPDPGWRIMPQQDVAAALLSSAAIPSRLALENRLTPFRDALSNLREQAVSILSIAIARHPDDFLARQLKYIEEIKIAAPGRIANAMLPQGKLLSRDTRAIAEGLALAPHQVLKAITISWRLVTDGSPILERAVRLSANHVQRVERLGAMRGNAGRNVVVGHGHSSQWRDLKDFIKERLGLPHDEFNRLSAAGVSNTDRLTEMLDAASFAFVVLTGEDELKDGALRARQNVVHEVGLFQGRLGFKKAIVMLEEGCEEFSNIAGLGQIRFPKGDIRAVFEEVRKVLEREGVIPL